MADQEQDKFQRRQRKAAVTREVNKLKRLKAEGDENAVKGQVIKLKDTFDNFERAHLKYHSLLENEDQCDESDVYFAEVESNYVDVLDIINVWLTARGSTAASTKVDDKSNIEQGFSSSPSSDIASMMNLPRVDLEPFDGDSMLYHSFISIFDENIDKVLRDGNSKLMRLIQYTTGKAREAIRSCSLIGGDDGYTQARSILSKRFGNDHMVTERIVQEIRTGKPIRHAGDLQQLADELSNCEKILRRMNKISEIDSQSCIVEVAGRLQPYLRNRWKRHAVEVKRNTDAYPKFEDLVKFIVEEAEQENDPVYGRISSKVNSEKPQKFPVQKFRETRSSSSFSAGAEKVMPVSRTPCLVCRGDHRVLFCNVFRNMKVDDRIALVKEHNLCENCLLSNHIASNCRKTSICSVPGCGLKHTKYVHVGAGPTNRSDNLHVHPTNRSDNLHVHRDPPRDTPRNYASESRTTVSSNNANCSFPGNRLEVCVPIVSVRVDQHTEVTALLDTGSTASFCSKKLVDLLGLKGEIREYALNTLSKSEERRVTEVVKLNLMSCDGREQMQMSNVYVVDEIPVKFPQVDVSGYTHLQNLVFPGKRSEVDILIGLDHAAALVPLETRVGSKLDPFAVRTLFGWSINGPTRSGTANRGAVSHFVTTSLDQDVQKLWQIEDDGLARDEISWSVEDRKVIDLWDTECKFVDGHYQLPIPWKESVLVPNNYPVALSRLKSNVVSLRKRGLFDCYDAEVKKLLVEGHAEVVPSSNSCGHDKLWYLPHQAVLSDKKPGKIRVVFDCACKYQGQSLNDKCLQGPDLNNKLFDVLVRFRNHELAVMADIQAMYYQVRIPPEQRDSLRFLWLNSDGGIVEYRMTSHVFGGVWCACAATYALRRSVSDFSGSSKCIQEVIEKSFYVDDCLVSFETVDEALEMVHGVTSTLKSGGFRLTKFVSNSPAVLDHIPLEDRAAEVKDLNINSISKALGVRWDVWSDQIYFDGNLSEWLDAVTKRKMLSLVCSMFDPLGLISPVIIRGRILFQDATRLKIGWDENLPAALQNNWNVWFQSLSELAVMQVQRCIKPRAFNDGALELHHFSDASSKAYGCCSYLRCINANGKIHVSLICSKSRVAPVKVTTIPRLELQGALLAARMDAVLRKDLQLILGESHFWVDSEVVLAYISNDSQRFHVFVANRVSEIRSLTCPRQWHHIPGSTNPADIITRGMSPDGLKNSCWLNGPDFLHIYKSGWNVKVSPEDVCDGDPEVRKSPLNVGKDVVSCIVDVEVHPLDKLINHYSSWLKLKRAVSWWLRLRKYLRCKRQSAAGNPLSAGELKSAEIHILRYTQAQVYSKDFDSLSKSGFVSKTSSLRSLLPRLNENCLISVGGRLNNADLSENGKNPYIVPHNHPVARLIVREYHNRAHLGIEWCVSLIRQKFWITKVRGLVKQVKRNCVTCKRLYGNPSSQLMADLPFERTEAGKPPFTYVGVDCFGPIKVKVGRSQVKRYGCLFSCFVTRAVHIEKLNGLDTDSFLNGLRRFVARRGQPVTIWSDNGTNFVGGQTEIRRSLKDLNQAEIQAYCTNEQIEWKFIPPGAPHMGGLWERMVRTVKRVLNAITEPKSLYDDVLETLLCEVESIVNGRPITKLSNDPLDPSPLTPNHLLLLRNGPPPLPGVFEGGDMFRKRWRHVQAMADQFWKRWVKEYLPLLQPRAKWTSVESNVEVGDIVLVLDENTPRGLWPLGLIVQADPSADGLVRSVKVRTKSTDLVRPISKIVKLESHS